MKTRIKTVIYRNGKATYYPQYRGWFLWKIMRAYIGKGYYGDAEFNNLKDCEKFIDDKLGELVLSKYTMRYPQEIKLC
jgi:hypothetical protein